MEKALRRLEDLATIAHGTSEDTSEDVPTSLVAGLGAVSDGDGQSTDVICDNTVCHVHALGVFLHADHAAVLTQARGDALDGGE